MLGVWFGTICSENGVLQFRIDCVIARIFVNMKVSCKHKEISNGILLFNVVPKETDECCMRK
jgi:hypothetical protein